MKTYSIWTDNHTWIADISANTIEEAILIQELTGYDGELHEDDSITSEPDDCFLPEFDN